MTLSEHFRKGTYSKETDKGTVHDYIDGYYSKEFTPRKSDNIKILEIGIWEGGSLHLWNDWFENAEITGVEVNNRKWVYKPDNILVHNVDGYSQSTLELFEDEYFDYIIDDGPHNVNSQIYSIENWFSKVKKGGKLIIEDIQNIDASRRRFKDSCEKMGIEYNEVDLRSSKGRHDDVLIILQK